MYYRILLKIIGIELSITNNIMILHSGGICKTATWKKERCLKKSEVGSFESFMQAGDPCFLHDDGKRVFAIFIIIHI